MSTIAKLMGSVGGVADAFVADKRLVTGLNGPVGSAKTTSCIKKSVMAGMWQNPGPDGVLRARGAVVRDTYPQLKKTVLESWHTWFPKTMGDWNGDSPMTHKIAISAGALRLELEMVFAAIGEARVEDVMRGWELTFLWLNEADLLAREVFRLGITRIGRYPSASMGGCAWRGIFMDLNAPDTDNWTYPLLWEQDMGLDEAQAEALREVFGENFGIGFHRQPGGRSKNPAPENIQNLPIGYYEQMMIGQSQDFIRRMIDNEPGAVRSGMPVYPEFRDSFHVMPDQRSAAEKARNDPALRPVKGIPIDIGVDGGLTPAAVFGQQLPNGQRRVLGELVVWVDAERQELLQIGPSAFGKMVRQMLADRFPDCDVRFCWGDPAIVAGESASGEDLSWRQLFQKALGVKVLKSPVKANSLELRLEAVRKSLRGLVLDGMPQYLLSPDAKFLRRGKNSGYVYRRTGMEGGDSRYKNEPVKNQHSHVQDAEQYLFCGWERSPADYSPTSYTTRAKSRITLDSDYELFGDAA